MSELLLAQEVGSLAKPDWRVAVVAGNELNHDHIGQIRAWGERLGFDHDEIGDTIYGIQSKLHIDSPADQVQAGKLAARHLAARYAVRLQEKAGLDIIYDGEQDRSEMYQHAVTRTRGFEPRGLVRAFDNRSYKKFAVVGPPTIAKPWHSNEVERLQKLTDKQVKVPITGPYTLADWSYDEHFGDRRELVLSLARDVIRPNLVTLLKQGVEWIQIDEPAAGTKRSEIGLFVDSFNEATAGLLGKFSIHLCYSDWQTFVPEIERLENCSQFSMEFANRDNKGLGTTANDRPAYEVLSGIHKVAPETAIGLGVVSIHEDYLESPELIRDRILRAVDMIGDPAKVFPSPDCGLRTRSWNVAYEKLARTVEGTQLAKQVVGN